MKRTKYVESAKFSRATTWDFIEVLFPGGKTLSISGMAIESCTERLSEIELEEVIEILLRDKTTMQKQHNFPPIYDEMLSAIIKVQRERYGVKNGKRRELPHCRDISTLETLFEQNYDITDVHIDTIDINANLKCGWNDLTLIMKFREVKEDE